ncbi:hypothetical protein J7E97_30145, partial [Streptomyces sp. ISL-66]|uniref:polymorphic toxin-type HINT domain-containing protein n=1 Tax=Streptomyces sp. ISL-66 TaxID=2819186 RepID=UPI001C19D9D6
AWAGDKGFIGGTKEKATGFTLLGAREYDPTTGRFISPDPLIDAGDPQQWNAYAYSNNSPINASDPSGLIREWRCESNCPDDSQSSGNLWETGGTDSDEPDPSALNEANNNVTKTKKKRDKLIDEVVDMVGDLIGYNDARDCFTKGDVMACINTALNFVPWGKLFKAVKIGIKAFKIYKEVNKAYDAIHEAERGASKAAEAFSASKKALKEARDAEAKAAKSASEKAAKESASDSAGTEARSVADEVDAAKGGGREAAEAAAKCNSFPTGVQVLMADGSAKSIEDVKDGDVVMATDPQTGETRPKTVTTTITTPDDKDFTDLTLTDEASPRGPPTKVTSTYHHPYWSETRHQWIDAGELTTGEQLRQPDGTTLTVTATRTYPYAVTTHNLTVDDFHTYYVLAGLTPVLVHNCDVALGLRKEGDLKNFAESNKHEHFLGDSKEDALASVRNVAHEQPSRRIHIVLDGFKMQSGKPGTLQEVFEDFYKEGRVGKAWITTQREMNIVGDSVRLGNRTWDSITFWHGGVDVSSQLSMPDFGVLRAAK